MCDTDTERFFSSVTNCSVFHANLWKLLLIMLPSSIEKIYPCQHLFEICNEWFLDECWKQTNINKHSVSLVYLKFAHKRMRICVWCCFDGCPVDTEELCMSFILWILVVVEQKHLSCADSNNLQLTEYGSDDSRSSISLKDTRLCRTRHRPTIVWFKFSVVWCWICFHW